ncbi:MAG: phosphatase PAP2 family protein [Treponema sp.]|jgi:membrane-associated phospholipid phosphatase|nr:phosphatase PAP2 family protein [Treponema sp.]
MNEDLIQLLPVDPASWNPAYRWGIELIVYIQQIEKPLLTEIIKIITSLGTELFYIPAILLIYWCINEKKGFRLGVMLLISIWINMICKGFLKMPRPYEFDRSIGLAFEPSYGMPSGHAQITACFWIPLADWLSTFRNTSAVKPAGKPQLERAFFYTAAGFIILLIGFTRLYLGVHFPTDLLGGWVLAGIILAVYFIYGKRLAEFLQGQGLRIQLIVTAFMSLGLNVVYPQNRSLSALFLGFCVGYALMRKHLHFSVTSGEVKGKRQRFGILALRYLFGIAGAACLILALKFFLPGEDSVFAALLWFGRDSPAYELAQFLRYGSLGLWAAAGAPWLFLKLKLAAAEKNETGTGYFGGSA